MTNDDLISRTAAMNLFLEKPPEYYHTSYIVGELYCLPSVIAVPVVHGRWIDHKDEHQCSACKEFTVVDAYAWIQLQYDFCPHCGAKMDGGDDK